MPKGTPPGAVDTGLSTRPNADDADIKEDQAPDSEFFSKLLVSFRSALIQNRRAEPSFCLAATFRVEANTLLYYSISKVSNTNPGATVQPTRA